MTKQNKTVKSWEIDGIGQVSVTPHSAALSPYEPRPREISEVLGVMQPHLRKKTIIYEFTPLLEALEMVLDSAIPNEKEHPTMFAAWQKGRQELAKWKR